jgi:hypothetical protein
MITPIVLDASGAVEAIAEVLPFIYMLAAIAACLYIGLIIFFVFVKSHFAYRRIFALLLSFLFIVLAIRRLSNEGSEFGVTEAVLFFPFSLGLFMEYLLRKKRHTT